MAFGRGVVGAGVLAAAVLSAQTTRTSTLLLELFSPDGRTMTIYDFAQQTNFTPNSKWIIGENYGVYAMGQLPASNQIGKRPVPVTEGSRELISWTIPANQPVYFTALWKADGIGTVFMRADNAGKGYTVPADQSLVLQIPYEFALSEYAVATQLAASAPTAVSAASAANLQRAATLVQAATSAGNNSAKAVAAYQALSVVMPLKEQLAIEISNAAISRAAPRKDFILNYEGFGSWVDARFKSHYAQAKLAGFTQVLTAVDWNFISPTPGVYNYTRLDQHVDEALAQGYSVAFSINQAVGSMPDWVVKLPFEDRKRLYFDNAFRIAQRYKDKVAVMYPQAEPGLVPKGNTLAQLAELTAQSLAGARAAAPGLKFGLYISAGAYVGYNMNYVPGEAYYSDWDVLNYLVQNGIKADFIGLEMQYGTVFAPLDLQRQGEILDVYYDLVKVPILIGETGYSSRTENYGIPGPYYWRDGLTEQAQAQWVDGLLRIAYSRPFMKGFYWVHVDPDNNPDYDAFLSIVVGTSIFHTDGTKKRAYGAFQTFSDWVANAKPNSAGPAASIEATVGGGQSAAVNTVFATPLQAIVRDYFGNPVPNVKVTFTAPSSGPSGTFPGFGRTATATTNSAGIAIAPAFAATNGTGAQLVTATASGAPGSASFSLTNTASTRSPSITSVAVANGNAEIAQNAWIVIKGTNLAPAYAPAEGVIWSTAPEFATNTMPTQIGGIPVTVSVNNKPAFIYFVCRAGSGSPCATDQINALTPLDATVGPVQVVVSVGGVTSTAFTVNARAASPAFPLVGATQYLVATHADYSLVGPASLSTPGYPFTPARPGETLLFYAFGFGLPSTSLVNGSATQSGRLPTVPVIQIGGLPATVSFAGVIGPGLYQLNVVVPPAAPTGDLPVTASYNGANAPTGGRIAVKQ